MARHGPARAARRSRLGARRGFKTVARDVLKPRRPTFPSRNLASASCIVSLPDPVLAWSGSCGALLVLNVEGQYYPRIAGVLAFFPREDGTVQSVRYVAAIRCVRLPFASD